MNPLSDPLQRTLDYVRRHQPVSRLQLAQAFGISRETAKGYLGSLRGMGWLDAVGTGCNLTYVARDAQRTWRDSRLAQRKLKPFEQASSVWEYARRCQQ